MMCSLFELPGHGQCMHTDGLYLDMHPVHNAGAHRKHHAWEQVHASRISMCTCWTCCNARACNARAEMLSNCCCLQVGRRCHDPRGTMEQSRGWAGQTDKHDACAQGGVQRIGSTGAGNQELPGL